MLRSDKDTWRTQVMFTLGLVLILQVFQNLGPGKCPLNGTQWWIWGCSLRSTPEPVPHGSGNCLMAPLQLWAPSSSRESSLSLHPSPRQECALSRQEAEQEVKYRDLTGSLTPNPTLSLGWLAGTTRLSEAELSLKFRHPFFFS
jgi:hypothetical protein